MQRKEGITPKKKKKGKGRERGGGRRGGGERGGGGSREGKVKEENHHTQKILREFPHLNCLLTKRLQIAQGMKTETNSYKFSESWRL